MKRIFSTDWRRDDGGRQARCLPGLTLIECLFAMAVLAVAVLGLCHVVVAGHAHLKQGDDAARAVRLAEHLMEEIASRPYEAVGGARSHWGVADYDGFSEAAGALRDFTGRLYEGQDQRFARQASVSPCNTLMPALDNTILQGLQVEVVVSLGSGMSWRMTRFIPGPVSP